MSRPPLVIAWRAEGLPVEVARARRWQPSPMIAEIGVAATLVAAGIALRVWRLDDWMLDQDEFATFGEVKDISKGSGLAYHWVRSTSPLTHGLIGMSLRHCSNWLVGLRLVPLITGIVTLLVTWPLVRSLWGRRVSLVTVALLALSPLPVYISSLARYQSGVLLCGLVTTVAFAHVAAGVRPRRSLLLAGLGLAVGLGFHLSTLVIVPPAVIGLATIALRNRRGKVVLISAIATLVLLATAYYLRRQELDHVFRAVMRGYRLYGFGYKPFHLLGAVFFQVGPGICLLAVVGLILGCRRRDPAAFLMGAFAVIPIATLSLMAAEFATGPRYLHAAFPAVFLLAAYGAARILEGVRDQGLLASAAVLAVLFLPQMPTLVSNLAFENCRYDVRPAAYRMRRMREPGDLLLAESHALLDFYGQVESREIPRTRAELEPLLQSGRRVLLAALYQRGRLVGTLDPTLQPYIEAQFYLIERHAQKRLDFYRFEVRLFSSEPLP
ncbi:MAG: glycosyltransferase family 39 protein [Planctomycetota bacterium]